MKTPTFLRCLLGVLLVLPAVSAQGGEYNDYTWARNLTREFGMDEMAEAIFQRMSQDKTDPTVQQQGRLGLAEMKQVQARKAGAFDERHGLFLEAAKLMTEAVDAWPDKTTHSYFQAVFSLTDLLQERGEAAMQALADGRAPRARADAIREEANADYDKGARYLSEIVARMGEPNPEDDIQKWRVKNAAWYRLCYLNYNKMTTRQKDSTERRLLGSRLKGMLEEYILENETDNEEAMLGALYGYLLLGQAYEDDGDDAGINEATSNYRSVVDQIVWSVPGNPAYRLHPAVQNLVERAYYLLIKCQNGARRFEKAREFGEEMQSRFKGMNLEYRKLGRAARVEFAEAKLRLGDMNAALSIAAEVVESGGGDATTVLANRLIAEVIGATPDKTQFSPEMVRSAAKGMFSQGLERRDEAIDYLSILLGLIPKVADPETRAFYLAETWYDLGRAYYSLDRRLEAAIAMGEGARVSRSVARNNLNASLVQYWRSFLRELDAETRSPEIAKMLADCNAWIVANPVEGLAISPGSVRYEEARKVARSASDHLRQGRRDEAVSEYQAAAKLFAEAVELGGPRKEQSLIQGARIELIVGEIRMRQGKRPEAEALLENSKVRLKEFIAFCADPANRLTDPEALRNREAALADAHYSIARANAALMPDDKDANVERVKALWRESIEFLENYESRFASQPDFVISALAVRVSGKLELGDVTAAIADLEALREREPDSARTASACLAVGQALAATAEPEFDALVGKVRYSDWEEWDAVTKLPGFPGAQAKLRRAADYYKFWLYAGSGQDNFQGWNKVSYLYARIGDFEEAADVTRRALRRYDGSPRADEATLGFMRDRLLFSLARMAKAADAQGRAEESARLWRESGELLDVMLKDPSNARNPRIVRLAGEVYGGYVARKDGLLTFFPGQGRYSEARQMWERLDSSYRAQGKTGSPEWWEARFYSFHALFRDRKDKRQSHDDVKKALDGLKVVSPEFGGQAWRPHFEWLERQMF